MSPEWWIGWVSKTVIQYVVMSPDWGQDNITYLSRNASNTLQMPYHMMKMKFMTKTNPNWWTQLVSKIYLSVCLSQNGWVQQSSKNWVSLPVAQKMNQTGIKIHLLVCPSWSQWIERALKYVSWSVPHKTDGYNRSWYELVCLTITRLHNGAWLGTYQLDHPYGFGPFSSQVPA